MSHMRRFGSAPILAGFVCSLWLAGCAGNDTGSEAAEPAANGDAAASEDASGAPEVFFVNIEDGGTFGISFEVIFGVKNFNIVPIEDPLVVREGEGHYHLAFDVQCAAAGDIIIAGSPSYVHFGDGSDRITAQFEPGEHRLCLQIADGEHRVIDGPEHSALTKEIHFTVAEQ